MSEVFDIMNNEESNSDWLAFFDVHFSNFESSTDFFRDIWKISAQILKFNQPLNFINKKENLKIILNPFFYQSIGAIL